MASRDDFRKLREQTMANGADEAVTVNTRALIDKVLARYSSKWTTLRELIQNAADAGASRVRISFETLPSITHPTPNTNTDSGEPHASVTLRHVVQHHTVRRLVVTNNGQPLQESDWVRLRRIAEGNPDETKIGAFGVGFYSVFSDCDEPFVVSGRKTMAFYWKGNGLFTRSGFLPDEKFNSETSFALEYRSSSSPVPDLLSISQFLATSLTFVGLQEIELWLDDWRLVTLSKTTDVGKPLSIPRGINAETVDRLMAVQNVYQNVVQIKADWMSIIGWNRSAASPATDLFSAGRNPSTSLKSFFSKLTIGSQGSKAKEVKDLATPRASKTRDWTFTSQSVVVLRVSSVQLKTRVTSSSSKELERATKKPPPKQTTISILASPHNIDSTISAEATASEPLDVDIFAYVLPSTSGRIFIGFPTSQTTGLLCHVSAPSIIPTVERENIDLNARHVREWNIGILRAAGIACRIVFDGEMIELRSQLRQIAKAAGRAKPSIQDTETVTPQVLHLLTQHTFEESTPSQSVGEIISRAFWNSCTTPSMEVLSNQGILPSSSVRIVSEDLSFLDNTPIVPAAVMNKAQRFIESMFDNGLIHTMTIEDIKRDLDTKALNATQLTEFLHWSAKKLSQKVLSREALQPLFDVVVATIGDSDSGQLIRLSDVRFFQHVSNIPNGVPIPPQTISYDLIKGMPVPDVQMMGWRQLQIVPWLAFLVEQRQASLGESCDLTKSSQFASQVLQILSKQWDALSEASKNAVVETLRPIDCMPTKMGMRRPENSYFSNVKLFDDLPVIAVTTTTKEKFLKALGVRKTIEVGVVFDRLMNPASNMLEKGGPKWSLIDLVKYFVSVKADIPHNDIVRLRSTPICPVETGMEDSVKKTKLWKACELFEPTADNRALGLPTLSWPQEFRSRSPEGLFLISLGLRSYPSVADLGAILLRAKEQNDKARFESALVYYVTRFHVNGYSEHDTKVMGMVPIVPVEGQKFPHLGTSASVFANPKAIALGYQTIRSDLRPHAMKFGVEIDPPIKNCVELVLRQPPSDPVQARSVFEYLATRLVEIDAGLVEKVGNASIVPIRNPSTGDKSAQTYMTAPRLCFLGDPSTYGAIVPFVDFGPDANSLLLKLGSKQEPGSVDLAWMVVERPLPCLKALGQAKYLGLLRTLAESKHILKNDTTLWRRLKVAPCLLGFKEQPRENDKSDHKHASEDATHLEDFYDEDQNTYVREWQLKQPRQLVIVDSIKDYTSFREDVVVAPDEEHLELLYQSLGTPLLSSVVRVQPHLGPPKEDQTEAKALHKLIVERSRLFLYDYPHEHVLHDAKWIKQSLAIEVVRSISVQKSIKGYNRVISERRSAILRAERSPRLAVTSHFDLFEVSRELVHVLLKRPKQHDSLALDSIMESKLSRLRVKGYNIDRILRQNEQESRLAEEQQKRLADAHMKPPLTPPERTTTKGSMDTTQETEPDRYIPGAFNDSPDQPSQSSFTTNLYNSIRKTVGYNEDRRSKSDSSTPNGQPTDQSIRPTGHTQPPDSGKNHHLSSSIEQVSTDLRHALSYCRPHTSRQLTSRPNTAVVQQAVSSYCDAEEYKKLIDTGLRIANIRFFLPADRSHVAPACPAQVAFAGLLTELARVFGIDLGSMHMYDEQNGRTIAFNHGGALFFNYNFFRRLHADSLQTKVAHNVQVNAWGFWFVTVAHELAHNLVGPHDAKHSFYTESFVSTFMPAFMQSLSAKLLPS